jgi:uncharacterized repeat protein (TIGR01451 family)
VNLLSLQGIGGPNRLIAIGCFAAFALPQLGYCQNQPSRNAQQEMTTSEMQLPPQNQVLQMTIKAPQQVKASQSFHYDITVENTSQNVAVRNIKLKQVTDEKFSVESANKLGSQSSPQGQSGQQSGQKSSQQPSSSSQDSQQQSQQEQVFQEQAGEQSGQQQSGSSRQSGQQGQQSKQGQESKQGQQSQQSSSDTTWTIDKLMPGESQTIRVQATSDAEGKGQMCLAITSFEPMLCLPLEFVKPELNLTKRAPDKVSLCEPFRFVYTVENTGSGDPGPFEIRDDLGDGIQTESGDNKLSFQVDGLAPGEIREFEASVVAQRAGKFQSRAVAIVSENNRTRSQQVTTQVVQPNIAVDIQGPSQGYVDQPMQYTLFVANTGDEAAKDTQLTLNYPARLELADVGSVQQADRSASDIEDGSQRQQGQSQPDKPNQNAQSASQQQRQQQRNSQQNQPGASQQSGGQSQQGQQAPQAASLESERFNAKRRNWNLGTIEPGEVRKVTVTFRTDQQGEVPLRAIAETQCATAAQLEKGLARATAQTQANIIALPALMVAIVDQEDVVPVGQEVIYEITVKNQGRAADQNVEVTVNLPDELTFASVDGPTDAQSEGQTVSFQPIDQLDPGQTAKWTLRATAEDGGEVQTKLELNSQSLDEAVQSEEPTRLVSQTGG